MNNTRRTTLALKSGLFLAVLAVLFAVWTTSVAKDSHISSAGMGDLRRFEAVPLAVGHGGPVSAPVYTGMADWRRFEVEQEREALVSNSSYAGMGDLKHFEALKNIHPYAGVGDQRRLEAEAARLAAQAEYYAPIGDQQRLEAEAARWAAQAEYYAKLATNQNTAEGDLRFVAGP